MKNLFVLAMSSLLLAGCGTNHSIVTSAQTVLGLTVSENPATQLYEARVGLVVSQVAFVPGNTNSPENVPNVIQEFKVNNLFAGGLVYQRLAVGSIAVAQPGAAVMFSKDSQGNVVTNALQTVVSQLLLAQPKK